MHTLSGMRLIQLTVCGIILSACGPKYPNCNEDDDCHEGEFCVNNQCQQCREDSDCPEGQGCADGRCDPIEGFCSGTGDCPDGQECRNNLCVAARQTALPAEEPAEAPCTLETVYFAYDSASLEPSARQTISANARCIRERSLGAIHLTGHTDPRGTEEYNLALGDRRARAVKEYLVSLGVGADKLSSSSMGEEMARGTDESSWRQDRRVVFKQR